MRGRRIGGTPAVRHLAVTFVLLGCGAAVSTGLPIVDPASSWFFVLASTLLAVGLFASTSGIPRLHRADLGIVLLAVTVGVVVKAAIIAGVMVLAFREPAYLVLGAVMAQIDPLSVAALRESSRLSVRGRAVLTAWSSFDDPVTSVLVLALAAVVAAMSAVEPRADAGAQSLLSPVSGIAGNVALVLVAAAVWGALHVLVRRRDVGGAERPVFTATAAVALLGLAAVAVGNFLMFGLAAAGLFFRPRIEAVLRRLISLAFAVATVVLGIVAAAGIAVVPGLVLGVTAFAAQSLVATVVAWSLPRSDRIRLVLGQQSGITAIILALLMEPVFAGTVAVVAPAIVAVNVLHLASNAFLDRVQDRREAGSGPGVVAGSGCADVVR